MLAIQRWDQLIMDDWSLVTTNWTLYEALTILNGRRVQRYDLAMELLRLVERMVEIVDSSQFEQQALDIFISHSDKRWSVVDCANFVCIRERGTSHALSFDRDFSQAQTEFAFQVLGHRS